MKKQAKTIPFQATAKYYRRTTAKRCQYWDGSTNGKGCAILPDEMVPAMVTRWGFQPSRYRRPKDAYVLHTGEWVYVAAKVATDVDEFGPVCGGLSRGHAFKRIEDRWVYDRHVSQTRDEGRDVVKLHIVDGRVVEIVCTQGEFKGADMLDGMGEEFAHYYLGIPYAPAPLRPYKVQAQLRVA